MCRAMVPKVGDNAMFIYRVPLVAGSAKMWSRKEGRPVTLRKVLGAGDTKLKPIIFGGRGIAIVGTVDPISDPRAIKLGDAADDRLGPVARGLINNLVDDGRDVGTGGRFGDVLAGLLKAPPAAWSARALRPTSRSKRFAPGFYVWLDPESASPVYFEAVARQHASQGWRDDFNRADGGIDGDNPTYASVSAPWNSDDATIQIVSSALRFIPSAEFASAGNHTDAYFDSDDVFTQATFNACLNNGSIEVAVAALTSGDVYVGAVNAGYWDHVGQYGMWSGEGSYEIDGTGATAFVPQMHSISRAGSTITFMRFNGSGWDDILGPLTHTDDMSDNYAPALSAYADGGFSGYSEIDDYEAADEGYVFAGAAALTGTGAAGMTRAQVAAGGRTLSVTLTGDAFVT